MERGKFPLTHGFKEVLPKLSNQFLHFILTVQYRKEEHCRDHYKNLAEEKKSSTLILQFTSYST